MSKPYTPETIDIKMAYVTSFDPAGVHKFLAHMVAEMTTGHAADFDRWLEGVKREAMAKALRDFAAVLESEVHDVTNVSIRHLLARIQVEAYRLDPLTPEEF